jgi:class 3 adenylate cyclase/DNA-binding XRE family transcriptional regulator
MPNIPAPFMRPFGELLRHYRQLRGLTVEQLAANAGMPPSAVNTLESGLRTPPPPKQTLRQLSTALGLTGEDREMFELAGSWDSHVLGALGDLLPEKARKVFGLPTSSQQAIPPMLAAILVFMIADVRGYSRFTQDEGDTAAARLAEKFAALTRSCAEQWDGRLIELRGDEALVVFGSVRQALHAALDLRLRFAEASAADPDLPLPVGIGLDVGEAVPLDDGYRGAALNRAARLCSLAGAGEVLVTSGLAYIAPRVEGVSYFTHGSFQLKGFDVPAEVLRVMPAGSVEVRPELSPPALPEP